MADRVNYAETKGAFTLVELLVVIVIVMLLAVIVAPAFETAREQARRSNCRSRLKGLHEAAASYASNNRTLAPLVHKGDFSMTGEILRSGGKFAGQYMGQSWEPYDKSYANMLRDDNVFQCPSALDNRDYHPKKRGTNYRLTGFGLDLGGAWNSKRPPGMPALHPSMMIIGGTVQDSGGRHPAGQVCMAMDWISPPSGASLPSSFGRDAGTSLKNHRDGANVLYGSGAAAWVSERAMILGSGGRYYPPKTYGFREGGYQRTLVFTPDGDTVKSSSGSAHLYPDYSLPDSWADRGAGAGIMW